MAQEVSAERKRASANAEEAITASRAKDQTQKKLHEALNEIAELKGELLAKAQEYDESRTPDEYETFKRALHDTMCVAGTRRPAARWRAPVSRSTMRTRTLARAQLFDRARPAAALGRPGALALRRAARARNKSRPGLVALASPCVGARCGTPTQTSSCYRPLLGEPSRVPDLHDRSLVMGSCFLL